ncbi:MAG: hypothetical protein Hals2KO_10910 [Halioglobus sp.]
MQVFLHIGYPKTGSTAIQWHVFSNQGWFEKRGFYIPRTGYAAGLGHAFLVGGKSQPLRSGANRVLLKPDSQFQTLAEELKACQEKGFDKALITWEGFAIVNEGVIDEMAQALGEFDISLFAYLRDQVSLHQSAALQGLENLRDFTADRFFGGRDIPESTLAQFDFPTVLARWQQAFGDRLTARTRLFERSLLQDGNVVIDFLQWLGLPQDDQFALQSSQINHSLDSRAAALILVARAAGVPGGRLIALSRALSDVTARSKSTSKNFMSVDDRQLLQDFYRDSNESLFSEYPPENAPGANTDFFPGKADDEGPAPEFEYLREVYRALGNPSPEVWGGGPINNQKVGRVARAPNAGWRGPEADGVWSVGSMSELAFRLPETHPEYGPSAVELTLSGSYFEGHSATDVRVGGNTERMDLSMATLRISLDDKIRKDGVRIVLQHQAPSITEASAAEPVELAYKLRFLSYTFVWED